MVPIKISRLWITSASCSELLDPVIDVYSDSWKSGFRGFEANFFACSSDPSPLMIEGKMQMMSITGTTRRSQPSPGLCYSIEWKPDVELMTRSDLAAYCSLQPEGGQENLPCKQTVISDDIKRQAVYHIFSRQTSYKVSTGDRQHLQMYLAYIRRKHDELGPNFVPCEDLQRYIETSVKEISSPSTETELTIRIVENLDSILDGTLDALDLFFHDDLLARYYYEQTGTPRLLRALDRFVDLLGHQQPSLRVLEIGAGTGAGTRRILDILDRNGDSTGRGPRFSHYCYTDISPSFLEKARSRFTDYGDRMEYRSLDIDGDPLMQGFSASDFDVILAVNVVHATPVLDRTLSHIRQLLKPGGSLILVEPVRPDALAINFIFGLLPGWWLGTEPDRKCGPLLTEYAWDMQLTRSGFTGVDVAVEEDNYALLVTQKPKGPTGSNHGDSPMVLLASRNSPLQQALAERLTSEAKSDQVLKIDLESFTWTIPPESTFVFIPELEQNCTSNMSAALLGHLQKVFATASVIVWLAGRTQGESDPLNGMAVGLSRVCKSERPELQFVHVAVERERGVESIVTHLRHVLRQISGETSDHMEDEYREIDGVLHTNRVIPYTRLDRKMRTISSPGENVLRALRSLGGRQTSMVVGQAGSLETFEFVEDPRFAQPLGPEEVEVKIHATGLNFRDILVALGQIDDDFFGYECAGVVTDKGPAVENLAVGDRVVCMMKNTFATSGRCPAVAAVKLPDSVPMTVGAGIALTGTTAYYALIHIGRLTAGESVLIHSGAGGLGQAAIQIARARGAIVYTSVGTTEKKDFLIERYGLIPDHVFSSRTLTFYDSVQRLTKGRGVDVVLNSLSGEALQATWKCLAPFGRFLETGKKDINSSGQLPLNGFANNVSFAGIDLAHIIADRPILVGELLKDVVKLVEHGTMSVSSPLHTFPISKVEEAFRFMQSGKSLGKIVLGLNDDDLVATAASKSAPCSFDPNASYVLAGGLGGIGRSVSRWLVSLGARRLILLSRRTTHGPEVQEFIKDLSSQGVELATPPCDCSDREALRAALDRCAHMGPVRGCIQLSMVINEAGFGNLKPEMLAESLGAKVSGTANLHDLLPPAMDFFVMFSSISSILGSPGMAAYVMGNAFQDELAHTLRRSGRRPRATSVNLGYVANVGFVAESTAMASLQKVGFLGLTDAQIHALLAQLCVAPSSPPLPGESAEPWSAQIIFGLETLAETRARGADGGPCYARPLLSCTNALRLPSSSSPSGPSGGAAEGGDGGGAGSMWTGAADATSAGLRAARTRAEAVRVVMEGLVSRLALMLGAESVVGVDFARPLSTLGLDSLIAIEISNWFRRVTGAKVTVFELLGDSSVEDLAVMAVERGGWEGGGG